MKIIRNRFGWAALVAAAWTSACASTPTESVATGTLAEVAAFNPSRDRTCAGGCAVGSVCDEAANACVTDPAAPQLRSPISGSVMAGRPEITFTTGTAATASAIEICRDAACLDPVARLSGVDHVTLPAALARGTYFVRGWGLREQAGHVVAGATTSPQRVFMSTGRDVASKSALAWFADFNADGVTDEISTAQSAAQPRVRANGRKGRLTAGGVSTMGPVIVPDMDGDGRTELAEVRDVGGQTKLWLSRIDAAGALAVTKIDVQPQTELLLLGDVDRDGFFDLGAVHRLEDGVRLEIFYGGPRGPNPAAPFRRKTTDIRLPAEDGQPMKLASVSAVGDLDGDGYPDLALGGRVDAAFGQWGPTTPHAGVFIDGPSEGDRWVIVRGAPAPGSVQPFTQQLAALKSEGSAWRGLVPLGDVDGDGVMDVFGLDATIQRLAEYEADTHMLGHWNRVSRGVRPARGFLLLGGAPLRHVDVKPPSLVREGPAASYAYGPAIVNEYGDVHGLATVEGGRAREEYFFDVSVNFAGDLDGDGRFEVAFGMHGANAPPVLSGQSWDTFSDPKLVRTYHLPADPPYVAATTWTRFASFVEVRYGTAQGFSDPAGPRIWSPTIEASEGMVRWVTFPNRILSHEDGLFLTEGEAAPHMNPPSFSPFQGTFAGPADALVQVP